MKFTSLLLCGVVATTALAEKPAATAAAAPATAAAAKAFLKKTNEELLKLYVEASRTDWVKNTYITDDTEILSAEAAEALMVYQAKAIKEARKFDGVKLDDETARGIMLLKLSADLPAPDDPKKTTELADLASKMQSIYGKAKYCRKGETGDKCRDLEQLTKTMQTDRNYDALLDAWQGWHAMAPELRPMYEKYVNLANEGSKTLGFKDTGSMWRSRYDMTPEAFEAEMERLWQQVKPLYNDLHCYVRGRLGETYKGKFKPEGAMPAHILGNMWAQEWANIYPLVEPYAGQGSLDVTAAMVAKGITEKRVAEMGEEFFVGLGLKKLPDTFWKRSMLVKPKDRDVVCHASAWDVTYNNDVRIKMCIQVDEDNLITVHHELGHIYYYQYYHTLPVLFQAGAHDGFHEAIGDAVALSVNPTYLQKIGILKDVQTNEKALINLQMKDALDKVAFLPFGLLMDKWRWDVFSGKTKAADYNKRWWELRREYQGVEAPTSRDKNAFDPGAKYHIPANVPYARYFLARILQFQFHEAMCKAAGHKGPLHTCSIAGNKDAGRRLSEMLAMGASKPWPEAMQKLTGSKQMDATSLLTYFAPLQTWLKEQNKGKKCGW
jgi:peptidyl-dipeptidase A